MWYEKVEFIHVELWTFGNSFPSLFPAPMRFLKKTHTKNKVTSENGLNTVNKFAF